jgi:hypothetical protein
MSSRSLRPDRSTLAARLGAALITSIVVQRGRMRALFREAQHRGATYLDVRGEHRDHDEPSA